MGLHMKVGSFVNIAAVNAEKNTETWKETQNHVLDLTVDFFFTAVEPVKIFSG